MSSKQVEGKYSSFLKGTDDLLSPVDIKKILVLDIGSNTIRLGLSGVNYPLLTLPNIIVKSNNSNPNDLTQVKMPDYFGHKAVSEIASKKNDYLISYPLLMKSQEDLIWSEKVKSNYFDYNKAKTEKDTSNLLKKKEFEKTNQEDFSNTLQPQMNYSNLPERHPEIVFSQNHYSDIENFFRYIFEEVLQLESSNIELLILHSIATPIDFRLKLAEILFENFRLQSLNFMNTGVSSLFSSGRTSGITVELGHSSTNVIPIYEGLVLKHAQTIGLYGGRDVSVFLNGILEEKGISLKTRGYEPFSIIDQIKSKIVYTSFDYDNAMQSEEKLGIEETHFELPDGEIIEFDKNTKFGAAEMLLNPGDGFWTGCCNFNSFELPLHVRIQDSIQKVEFEMAKKLSNNILVVGGAALTSNLINRLRKDFNSTIPSSISQFSTNISMETNIPYSAWIGGSIMGSIATFQNLKIKKIDFDEAGDYKQAFLYKRTFI